MSDLGIYIPTWKRGPEGQRTWKCIPPSWRERTFFCVRPEEWHLPWPAQTMLLEGVRNIATTRQAIMERASHPFVLMLDDDLEFYRRPWQYASDQSPEKRYLLRGPSEADMEELFALLEFWIASGAAHAAVSMREGNNRIVEPWVEVGRGIRAVAYNRQLVNSLGCRFREESDTKEDFDMTLQLLRKGYANRISYEWAQGQPGSNTPGGCETYRDSAVMRQASEALMRLHPGFVRLRQARNKNWGGHEERSEVTVAWAKAYASAPQQAIF